tara:strand:- start:908 stop:3265 length:2358 start_codon:yes stop_codon:yes gene_type:complete
MNSKDNLISKEFTVQFFRYFSFWKLFVSMIIMFVILTFIYLRYTHNKYKSEAKIEIIDKSQDSEMALPTAMTIFNRSMINLDNEISVLNSYKIHEKVIKRLDYNVSYYEIGNVINSEVHRSDWFENYEIIFKSFSQKGNKSQDFLIEIIDNILKISSYDDDGEILNSYEFDKLNTNLKEHNLPFNLIIKDNFSEDSQKRKFLKINSIQHTVNKFRDAVKVSKVGNDSDQLSLSLIHTTPKISNEYLNELVFEFDNDGISDRQLVYKRTIDFVDSRFESLRSDLEQIENQKQDFEEENNISSIEFDASSTVTQKYLYEEDLFKSKSQYEIAKFLLETVSIDVIESLPINIGIDNSDINALIINYNKLYSRWNNISKSAGRNNSLVVKLENELNSSRTSINSSLESYIETLEISIANLEKKEKEFTDSYGEIPEIKKYLRSINRELEVKEALFVLLLQKREEAAINFAVIKPSVKIIDDAKNSPIPVSPKTNFLYLSAILVAFMLSYLMVFLWFLFDDKIHTRDDIKNFMDISIVGEIPFANNIANNTVYESSSRLPIAESIRMIISNLNFVMSDKSDNSNVILVTSSIKGEGKTIVSTNISSILANNSNKVLLIGSDLRNPQIHKYFNIEKDSLFGLTDYLSSNEESYDAYVKKIKPNFDILFSGSIPPNPTDLLSSDKFGKLIEKAKKLYDYVIIDSAPCLLVSDTFSFTNKVNLTLYVVRANHSPLKLLDFIKDLNHSNKLPKINLVLNGLGNSQKYGYKYSYQYGYEYGYNYGYGYGYSESEN